MSLFSEDMRAPSRECPPSSFFSFVHHCSNLLFFSLCRSLARAFLKYDPCACASVRSVRRPAVCLPSCWVRQKASVSEHLTFCCLVLSLPCFQVRPLVSPFTMLSILSITTVCFVGLSTGREHTRNAACSAPSLLIPVNSVPAARCQSATG